MPSAIKAYEFPKTPATIFRPASDALTAIPTTGTVARLVVELDCRGSGGGGFPCRGDSISFGVIILSGFFGGEGCSNEGVLNANPEKYDVFGSIKGADG